MINSGAKPLGWIEIPSGGFQPDTTQQQFAAPGGSVLSSYYQTIGTIVIDSTKWQGVFVDRLYGLGQEPQRVGSLQDFTSNAMYTAYAPIYPSRIMNPPLFWDVTYEVDITFAGAPDAPFSGLGNA